MSYLLGARFSGRAVAFLFFVLFAIPGVSWAVPQEAQLTPTSPVDFAHAGTSVSISGTTAVVGAPADNGGAGAAYVFTRSGTTWTYQTTLVADTATAGDGFGTSVGISAGVIAVGAPGLNSSQGGVYVFTGSGASWTQSTLLTAARGASGDKLGSAVSVQGFAVAAGAPYAAFQTRAAAGAAYVFSSTDSGANWQQFNLPQNRGQSNPGDHFGSSVSLSGSTVLVGAPNATQGNKANAGNVQIFINSGTQWTRQRRLNNAVAGGLFGTSVALYSNTAVIGAPGTNSGQGSAFVFTRSGTTWSPLGGPVNGIAAGDHFGASAALSGNAAVVGAPNAPGGANNGAAYVFDVTAPVLDPLVASDNAAGDTFGASVAIDAGRAVVGAPLNSNGSNTADGAAYVFLVGVPTITTFTSVTPEPSALGQQYTVTVQVTTDPPSAFVPTGTVDIYDPFGASCLAVVLDVNGSASCNLTAFNVGMLTITADYSGASPLFAASSNTYQHKVIGFSFVFVQQPGDLTTLNDVPQGNHLDGVTVQELDDSDALVTTDNTTQVQLSLPDPCNAVGTITFGPVTVVGGIADFTGVGPRFYTQTSGGTYQLTATATNALVSPTTSSIFDVIAPPPEFIFGDGFESCRL